MDFLANNIYDYCYFESLYLHKDKLINYLIDKNNFYNKKMEEMQIHNSKVDIKMCRKIKKKYLSIIKRNLRDIN